MSADGGVAYPCVPLLFLLPSTLFFYSFLLSYIFFPFSSSELITSFFFSLFFNHNFYHRTQFYSQKATLEEKYRSIRFYSKFDPFRNCFER